MKRIDVEFYGGQVITASIQKSYDILNMAVLAVSAKDMSKTTERMVQTANLGTSAGLEAGTPVLALGNIYGFSDSVGYGMIQDVSGTIQREDGIYYRIKTDIQGKSTGSGILLNLQGDVIGIVSSVSADEDEMVAAIGISSLKNILELLVNGEDVPYTGITGTDITDEAAEEQNLPTGVYVQNISADSPAMEAGIKNGDIITAVGGKTVTSMEEYQRRLLESTPDSVISVEGKRRSSEGYADIEYKVDLHR
jgi:serine protease Do